MMDNVTISVDIKDYLSDYEIKEIIADEVRSQIRDYVNEKVRFWGGYDEVISNAAYSTVRKMLDEQSIDIDAALTENVMRVIDDLTSYTVFYDSKEYEGHYWNRGYKSHGRKVLNEVVDELRPVIKDKIMSIINENIDADWLIDAAVDNFRHELREQLKN